MVDPEATSVGTGVPRLTARIIFNSEGLGELVVTDGQGNLVTERPIPERVIAVEGWDRALFNAGYRRTSDWRRSRAGVKCDVEALS